MLMRFDDFNCFYSDKRKGEGELEIVENPKKKRKIEKIKKMVSVLESNFCLFYIIIQLLLL